MIQEMIEGRVWVLRDKNGESIDDIDVTQIFPDHYIGISDTKALGQRTFSNLPGWAGFPKKSKPGDILVCGTNFGSGLFRQQAVDCFKALGISLIIAESFCAAYKRNAINAGFPVLVCPDICSQKKDDVFLVQQGDVLQINLITGEMKNITRNLPIAGCLPVSPVQLDILEAGNLFNTVQ